MSELTREDKEDAEFRELLRILGGAGTCRRASDALFEQLCLNDPRFVRARKLRQERERKLSK